MKPITFCQGGTETDSAIVVDEAQNLTPQEVKMLITRCGHRSKIMLTGDPYQALSSSRLDPISNGLTHTTEAMKGQELFGHITMIKSERSDVAELAAKLL